MLGIALRGSLKSAGWPKEMEVAWYQVGARGKG